ALPSKSAGRHQWDGSSVATDSRPEGGGAGYGVLWHGGFLRLRARTFRPQRGGRQSGVVAGPQGGARRHRGGAGDVVPASDQGFSGAPRVASVAAVGTATLEM